MFKYYILHKPYGYLSQFTKEIPTHKTLADLYDFPKDVYSVGRLDRDSEGLLIVTNDRKLTHRLLEPRFGHQRTYHVQVDGAIAEEAIQALQNGVAIKLKKSIHQTLPAAAHRLKNTEKYPPRNPPVRFRAHIPTSWISLTLTEGKNRQVRKMCAKVGFPVLRLIRYSIEGLTIEDLRNGEVREVTEGWVKGRLGL